MKFHKRLDGSVAPCHAKNRCRYEVHFEASSLEEAQKLADKEFLNKEALINRINSTTQYHGTNADFNEFSEDFIGIGNDSYGPGFYFVDNKQAANCYGNNVKEVRLTLENPYIYDGNTNFSVESNFINDTDVLYNILKEHPTIYCQSNDEENYSILGDYIEEYWDKDEWTKKEQDNMIRKLAEMNKGTSLVNLQTLFRDYNKQLMRGLVKFTGHDGIIIKMKGGLITVVWNKDSIKVVK